MMLKILTMKLEEKLRNLEQNEQQRRLFVFYSFPLSIECLMAENKFI